jgi:mannose-6-phosphate isomerase-like protein (cupin superfamily)
MVRELLLLIPAFCFAADERSVDPTFLRRNLATASAVPADLATPSARYKALFGAGDKFASLARGVSRYGELVVDPKGKSGTAVYPNEEHLMVVLEGSPTLVYNNERTPLRVNDFLYIPATVSHAVENPEAGQARVIIMGFRLPPGDRPMPPSLQKANINDVPLQTVGNHPPSTQYRLLMGDTTSKRDRLASAKVMTSLYIMEFAPGGTNFPHHHDTEEEIYLLLDGKGDMVAGSGMDGVEGRFPAKPGDAYFFRLNATVGFYSAPDTKSRILAVRSLFPFRRR